MNILVSACLLGVNCRYCGDGSFVETLNELREKHSLIPICPEVYGGMTTPREPSERLLNRVVTKSGEDVTEFFVKGAKECRKLAKFFDCEAAILKERSPSCGYGRIYDGSFSNTLVNGNGVLADLLIEEGITIFGESELDKLS